MNSLTAAIENLYATFSKYTTEGIHYCDCGCIKEEDVSKLNSKPLRQLEEDDLVSYHGSALYTWGDIEHYKHYLPRICELRSLNRSSVFIDLDEIFAKLEYANWTKWSEGEIQAIKDYVLADWIEFVNNENSEIRDRELEEYGKFFGIDELLKLWDISASDKALRNFVFFFYWHGNQILNEGLTLGDKRCEREFTELIQEKELSGMLEAKFFDDEKNDPEYAAKISVVLQMIEQKMKTTSQ